MDNPWLIALLGVSTVFLSLITISLILQVFKPIFGGREKPFRDPAPLPVLTSPTVGSAQAGGNAQLVAVISAAVAAASGREPASFRIAGIERAAGGGAAGAGFSTPIWGHIDRIGRTSFKA